MVQPGETLADRFVLERLAGTGAMGQVWLAQDRDSGSSLAVKLLAKSEEEQPARFLREALLLSQLDHPRIVRYVAHGQTPSGELYLAMEWLEGEDLASRLDAGALTIPETVALVRHVAQALSAAHAAGIVHRDIKPSNLFLPQGSIDAIKVLDFGIARVKDSTWTRTGLMLGTPAYMSPEQASGVREIDARADLFALGCVAFECLAGRPAFGGKQVFAVLRKILLEEAPSIAEVVSGIPPELDALLKRMMAKDPAARPQSAAEVDATLAGFHFEAVAPEPSRPPARLILSEREQRVVTALAIAEDESSMTTAATLAVDVLQPSPDALDPTGVLRGLLQRTAGMIGRCAPHASVLVFPPHGVPSDRAAQAAECALAMQHVWRGRTMALATDLVETGAWTDGGAAERASQLLLARAEPSTGQAASMFVDDVTASLLAARYPIDEGPHGFELRHEREPSSTSPPAGAPRSRFVGRERELDALLAILDECVEEPVARAVLVTAPPGLGKSRLRSELLDAVARRDPAAAPGTGAVQIWTARGEPLRAGSPFELISQLTACARPPYPEAAPASSEGQQRWIELLARECAAAPLLLVLDDLQWADALSLKLLDGALRELGEAALMVLAFARPEVHQLFPRLWSGRPLEEIRLSPLTRSAGERLVRAGLGGASSDVIVERILEQADGVPFYLEALAHAAARGSAEVPAAVVGLVHARFEQLDAQTRRVLRAASVYGPAFWHGAVRALVGSATDLDGALRTLIEQKLIAARQDTRFPGEQAYDFATTLVRESAYASLTDADRTLGHLLAADWLEHAGEQNAATISSHRALGGKRGSEPATHHAAG